MPAVSCVVVIYIFQKFIIPQSSTIYGDSSVVASVEAWVVWVSWVWVIAKLVEAWLSLLVEAWLSLLVGA